jgi:hypothetical protein
LQEAMARLLEITSQYATITQEGIDEFIATYELNEAEVYEATSFDAIKQYTSLDYDENADWADIEDFEGGVNTPKIVIHFETEKDKETFLNTYDIKMRDTKGATQSTWWPYKERADYTGVKIQE